MVEVFDTVDIHVEVQTLLLRSGFADFVALVDVIHTADLQIVRTIGTRAEYRDGQE